MYIILRRVARNLQWGGEAVSEVQNLTEAVYTWSRNGFFPKLVEDQKKVFSQVGMDFCNRILFTSKVKVVTFSLAMPMRGLFSILVQ